MSHGYFGDRFIQLAEAFGIRWCREVEVGEYADVAEVEDKLAKGGFKAVTVTHVDTSTGVEKDLRDWYLRSRRAARSYWTGVRLRPSRRTWEGLQATLNIGLTLS